MKLCERPSSPGVQLLRNRQEALEKKVQAAHILHENEPPSDLEMVDLANLTRLETQLRRIESMGEGITQCEAVVAESELMEGIVCMEKLSLPKFSGSPWEYTEFKSLFIRRIATLRAPKVVIRE